MAGEETSTGSGHMKDPLRGRDSDPKDIPAAWRRVAQEVLDRILGNKLFVLLCLMIVFLPEGCEVSFANPKVADFSWLALGIASLVLLVMGAGTLWAHWKPPRWERALRSVRRTLKRH